MSTNGRLRPVVEGYDASWIREGVLPFHASSVGTLVPVVFEAYGRILHPASGGLGVPIRWDTVAAWSGRTMHPLAEFVRLARPQEGTSNPAPFVRRPDDGVLAGQALSELCVVLADHTTTPEDCFVGVWEGYGSLGGPLPTFRLELPGRVHHVFEGPLEGVQDLGRTARDGSFIGEPASVIWPADRAWFVASDVDQDSTFVGGSTGLVDALVNDPRLEVWPVAPTDSITATSDTINEL